MCKEKRNEMDRVGYLGISAFWAVLTNLHVRQHYKTSSLAVIPPICSLLFKRSRYLLSESIVSLLTFYLADSSKLRTRLFGFKSSSAKVYFNYVGQISSLDN